MGRQECTLRIVHQLQIQWANEQGLALIRAVLFNLGYTDEDLVSSYSRNKGSIELFDRHGAKLERIEKLFYRLSLPGVKIKIRRLAPKDWLTRWKSQWKPAALTKKLDVVPVWCRDKYRPRRGCDHLLMDTLLSFGTGLHETTRIVAQFIDDKKGGFTSFLDIGTGTGILGFVALKYGAKDVLGLDIDPLSMQAARQNMKANSLYFKLKRADIGKYRVQGTYDFVAANLITHDLIKHASTIISLVNKGGLLAVSGISSDNLNRLRKAYSSEPLKCLKISRGKQWTGLLYQRKML